MPGVARSSQVQTYYEQAATGTLPALSFVDPAFNGEDQGTSGDEHPHGDVRVGQAFIADVVHAFLESPQYNRARSGSNGQAIGSGCVYPSDVPTIADQLSAAGLTWRDYNEDMGADPSREASECGHPGINSVDQTQKATATDEYAARHNPFVYFHSIIDDTALCDSHVVNLSLLPHDLASAADTPNYVFITP